MSIVHRRITIRARTKCHALSDFMSVTKLFFFRCKVCLNLLQISLLHSSSCAIITTVARRAFQLLTPLILSCSCRIRLVVFSELGVLIKELHVPSSTPIQNPCYSHPSSHSPLPPLSANFFGSLLSSSNNILIRV